MSGAVLTAAVDKAFDTDTDIKLNQPKGFATYAFHGLNATYTHSVLGTTYQLSSQRWGSFRTSHGCNRPRCTN